MGVTQGVAGEGILKAEGGSDVARLHPGYLLAVISMHAQQSAQTLLSLPPRIIDLGPGLRLPRIDPEIDQPADKGVGDRFKGKSTKGHIIAGRTRAFLAALGFNTFYRWHLLR